MSGSTPRPRRIPTTIRPYLPVLVVAAAFLVMAAAVDVAPRSRQVLAGDVEVPLAASPNAGPSGTGGDPATDGDGVGTTTPGAPTTVAGAPGSTPSAPGSPSPGGGQAPAGGIGPCADRALQVPGDPYSPPCLAFSGDNGGTTSPGVTDDEIVITIRSLEGPSAAEIFADISGESVEDSEQSYENTIRSLGQYFSQRFQFYGRTLRFEFYRGEGSGASELLGGGLEAALADSVRARDIGAFADLSAITTPYADALSRQKIVGIGAPYPSRSWFVERRPYAYSLFPDGTIVSESGAAATAARLAGQETAEYAGEALRSSPRVYGLVAPENAEYQESVERYIETVAAAGIPIAVDLRYKLDISSMPNQASNIIARLKDAGVTSIVCACDPVMLALGMTPKANEQDFEPEWITGGLAFVEQDIVAQLIDDRQWRHAFGTAFNAESEPIGGSYPYAAYKQISPGDEPAFGVEEIYYSMYILALGIHLAGPNLTPESFEAGLFSYPAASGPRGTWSFGPGDYTPIDDFREIWWDPDRISPQNGKPGAWVQLGGGQRWTAGTIPSGRIGYFQEG